jgi:hypothetical protein
LDLRFGSDVERVVRLPARCESDCLVLGGQAPLALAFFAGFARLYVVLKTYFFFKTIRYIRGFECIYTHIRAYTHPHAYTYIHIDMYIHIRAYKCTYAHITRIYTHVYTYTTSETHLPGGVRERR